MSAPFKVEIVAREVLSRFWSTVTKLVIDYTDRRGRTSRIVREINDHGMAAAVLAFDPDRRTVLLVRQMRIAAYVAGYEEDMLEVCAGLLDGDEPAACALKEAREELGYRLHTLEAAGEMYASPGSLTERVSLFVGHYNPADRLDDGGGIEHEGEDIEVVEMPFDEAFALIASGGIVDAKTIILLQHLQLKEMQAPAGAK
jgi:nudix-type nucleoside diphosphatase (YffH/AdpP family)